VRSLIENQEPTWRQRFVALLLPPLEKTKQVDVAKKSGEMSQKWCSEVYGRFKKNLRNRYPFNQRGPDAAIADLTDFFGPIGTVWSFYDKELKADVVRIGDRFAFAKGLGVEASSVYRRELLNFLSRAQEVRNVLFPSNTAEAQLSFQVHMQPVANVASVTLTVDGQSYTYSNGPEQWFPMKWPMVGKAPGASIVVRSSRDSGQIKQGGDWGFFHLLEEGTVRPSRSGNLTVSWHFPTLNAEVFIDFKPARNETLFGVLKDGQKPQLLQAFRSPGIDPPVAAGYNTGGCTK
jgi:type VI secretion system protein ImpL